MNKNSILFRSEFKTHNCKCISFSKLRNSDEKMRDKCLEFSFTANIENINYK